MATASTAIYDRLSTFAGLVALIGTRVFPGAVPQEEDWPAVAYVRIDEDQEEAFGVDPTNRETGFEVTSTGRDYDEAEAVHIQVRKALQRARGTFGGVEVHDILLRGGEGPMELDDPKCYEATQRIVVRYTEP